jgi:hypothetical protein
MKPAAPLDYLSGLPWRDESVPAGVPGVPTMLSKSERRLLYSLARDYAAEDAAIVDAGCFLGGSTAALLAGLRDRPKPWRGPPVASYDLFRIEAYTIQKFFRDDPKARVGESFRPQYDANVTGFGVPHDVHEGDIAKIGWSGGQIDILFLDVLKKWEVNDAVLRDFFPSLVPGRSVIIHQDYGSGWVPWIPITVELMGDALRLIDGMEWGSHVFFLEREVSAELIREGLGGLDLETKFALIDQAVARSHGWVRGMTELSRTELIVERDGPDAGLRDLARIVDAYSGDDLVLSFAAHVRAGLETDWAFTPSESQTSWTRRFARARRRVATTLLGR